MNQAAIDPGSGKCSGPQRAGIPAVCTSDFYKYILNIAGIGAGDTVACLDGTSAFVEEALSARGACIRAISPASDAGRGRKSRRKKHARTDAVLWAVNGFSRVNLARTLENLQHSLKPGGRLVLWTPSNCNQDRQACPEWIDNLLVSTGFVSVIVGRMPLNGQGVVVATGVSGKSELVKIKGGN